MGEALNESNRAYALDAFRGFAILAMILSGQLPFHVNTLPPWMYHRQVPPPEHKWIPTLPGITWVDLVFPFFLFAMGAAFPLAFSRRIEKGLETWKIYIQIIFERGILLAFFALYVQAIRPFVISKNPDQKIFIISLLAFFVLFLIYTRFPQNWNKWVEFGLRVLGWGFALAILLLLKYPDGSGFSFYRSDIIIVVLANMAFFGGIIWMLTRQNLLLRLGLLGILMAIRLSNMPQQIEGWVSQLWNFSPVPWIYKLYYLQYLFIVIPGSIVGESILRWMKGSKNINNEWSQSKYILITILMLFIVLEILVGMYNRWLIETTILTFVLLFVGYLLMKNTFNENEKFYKEIFLWACYWIILGLFLEPYEGGIRKDKPTLSYYFITSGLSILSIIFFSIIIDVFKKQKWFKLLIDNGQNPMIAYAGINNFIIPILYLTGAMTLLNKLAITPWSGFVKGLIITFLLTFSVSLFTKFKIIWRT